MTDKRPMTFDERINAPIPRTFVSEAIDYTVDFEVREETALARAHRKWGTKEKPAQ